MDLKTYFSTFGKSRADFAKEIGSTLNYINNLCQRPNQVGKKTALRISQATNGKVSVMELLFPEKES